MLTVSLLDYGAGNPASVIKAFGAVGARAHVAASPSDIEDAIALVIPGVGHFCSTARLSTEWRDAIRRRLDAGAALLGICLGMQWLFDGSDEAPDVPGLGLFRGRCFALRGGVTATHPVKVPHVGWNTLTPTPGSWRLTAGLAPGASVYFTHTFAAPLTGDTVATTTHGLEFASAIERGRVMGTQFHPEKSGAAGLGLLATFVTMAGEGR